MVARAPRTAAATEPVPDKSQLGRLAGVLIVAAGVIFAVGLALGLAFVGIHGGGVIQGWDNHVQSWSLHHRSGLVGAGKIVAFIGDAPKLAVVAVIISVVWWLRADRPSPWCR